MQYGYIPITEDRRRWPKLHLALAGTIALLLLLVLLALSGERAVAARTAIPLTVELVPKSPLPEPEQFEPIIPWRDYTIKSGDSLSVIFEKMGLGSRDVHNVMANSLDANLLLKIRPGQKLSFHIESGTLLAMDYHVDAVKTLRFEQGFDGFSSREILKEPEVRRAAASGTVTSSLYVAAEKAGMSRNLIMEMANIFGSVVDFVYDVRQGDRFTVVYEELFIDGERYSTGNILAAEYATRKKTWQAFRHINADGSVEYFSSDGESMRQAFLRAPLDFTRISSGFNLKRLHPIFKKTRPHRGIDYAASRGTPVYAAGDGRVLRSGFAKGNGNYVVLSHGSKYQTKYLHLHKRAVKKGSKVKQRQIIGWVGSTGYATGPHLHYEFLVNGVHRNPRTIYKQLPRPKTMADTELAEFRAGIAGLQMQLTTYAAHESAADADAG